MRNCVGQSRIGHVMAVTNLGIGARGDPLVAPAVAAEGGPGAIELVCGRLPTTSASVGGGVGV